VSERTGSSPSRPGSAAAPPSGVPPTASPRARDRGDYGVVSSAPPTDSDRCPTGTSTTHTHSFAMCNSNIKYP